MRRPASGSWGGPSPVPVFFSALFLLFAIALLLGLTACTKRARAVAVEAVAAVTPDPCPDDGLHVVDAAGRCLQEATRAAVEPVALEAVRFEFDQADLTPAARRVLRANAQVLRQYVGHRVRISGHCDARGTLEYNLALGDRRARAVLNHYAAAGIPKGLMEAVSYGEERPACTATADDACHALNRRAETALE